MVFTLVRSKIEKKQQLVDTQEAYNLWSILKTKYQAMEKLKSLQNFSHDPDLKLMIRTHLLEFQENVTILEKEMEKYSIKPPCQNRYAVNSPINPEAIQDELIANEVFIFIQEHLENMLRAFRTSMTNDSLRTNFKQMALKTINRQNLIIQHLKVKGWIETPPLYLDLPKNINEKLTSAEAYHLWDHLAYLYGNLRETKIYYAFAFDGDFKVILMMGLNQLQQHVRILEQELEYFGIPLPKRPPIFTAPPNNTEVFEDDYMYRLILLGIQSIITLLAQALKQSTFNDRIRGLFKKLLVEEINLLDKFIKFGKTKGWLNPVPNYKS